MRTLNDYFLTAEIADVSTAGQVYITAPDNGQIIKIFSVLGGAISGADAGLTAKINGTAVTGGTITIANSSSAAGDVDACEPTGANDVIEGDAIEIETDGASTGAVAAGITVVIRR